jgi:subtilisin family serine protease
MKKYTTFIFILSLFAQDLSAQTIEKSSEKGWHLMDQQTSGFYGIGLEKTYVEVLSKIQPKKKVIVAVIDSGVDTLHEDLKSVLWKNKKEIPGNKIDDDKNGYIDDVYGWNFIGGKDGQNVSKDSYEGARVYYKLKKIFDNQKVDEKTLSEDQLYAYQNFQKAKNQLEEQAKEASMYVMILKDIVAKLPKADSLLKNALNKSQFTGDELQTFKSDDLEVTKAKTMMLGLFQQTRQMEMSNSTLLKELFDFYEGEKSKIETLEIEPVNYRGNIVKDNYDDPTDRFYGNNDVMASGSEHGTHVSGIIGANRENNLGIAGVANNVEIMTVRAVPDGDEHDKDIANAIRYAADNGAWVVNMSFGKSFSPEKKWVDEAVKYAESKGVLLIHAAGNDAKNIDVVDNFPSMYINNDTLKGVTNWINVGASGSTEENLAASFSNFGRRDVSVFAPGVKIYSTLPGGNVYGNQDGTSMAAPVVSGLAALILSYYPELTASQVKSIIEKSVTKIDLNTIIKPGTENEKTNFSELSNTGGIINAYQALIIAAGIKGERKIELEKIPSPKKQVKK